MGPAPKSTGEFLGGKARFGKLSLVREVEPRTGRQGRKIRLALCRCDCGGEVTAELRNLKRGFTTSCGCIGGGWQVGVPRKQTLTPPIGPRHLRRSAI